VVVLYAEDIAGGAGHQITVTLSGVEYFQCSAIEVAGLLSTGSLDVSASDSTSDAAYSSGPATLTASYEYVIGVHVFVNTTAAEFNPDAVWTRVLQASGRQSLSGHFIQDQVWQGDHPSFAASGQVSVSGVIGWPIASVMVAFKVWWRRSRMRRRSMGFCRR